ncbi:MAG: AAA family ATPase [Gemmatimonas sp.]
MSHSEGIITGLSCPQLSPAQEHTYPYTLPAVRDIHKLHFHPAVNFFVGENGSGKSTVLEALAVASGFNAEGGSRNFRFATRRSESELGHTIRLHRRLRRPRTGYFLRAESFFNVATEIEKLDSDPNALGPPVADSYGPRALHEQSHGEAFWSLFMHRFSSEGLYLLDEPEAALSPARQFAFLVRLHELVQQGCQFIIATHAPILLAYPVAHVWSFSETGIEKSSFRDTAHYQLTKRMLDDPEGMIQRLLSPE